MTADAAGGMLTKTKARHEKLANLLYVLLTECGFLADSLEGYKTEHFWQDYPYRDMTFGLKTYYLLQAAYWCQQLLSECPVSL